MRTLLRCSIAALWVALACGPAALAEGPEITYPASAAESGLQDDHRQQIDAYVKFWTDTLATANTPERIDEARRRLLEGYNKFGSKASEHFYAYAASAAKNGATLLGGKPAPGDPLTALKEINFSISVLRMTQTSLQPLAEAMVTHRNAAVRYFGWQVYSSLRNPILAVGGKPADAFFTALTEAPGKETDPYVLSQMMAVFRMPPQPDPTSGINAVAYSQAQSKSLAILGRNWTGLCLKVMSVDASASEAATMGLGALRLLQAGLGQEADSKRVLQLVANLTYAAGKAFDRALQMQEAAAVAQAALAGTEVDADPAKAEALAKKFGMTVEKLAAAKGDAELAVSSNSSLLTECEAVLNQLTEKGQPGERRIRRPLGGRGAAADTGAAVMLGVLEWVTELRKSPGIQHPNELLKSPPATAPAPANP